MSTESEGATGPGKKDKKQKKAKKLESAWIGFFGRIVAQVVGAAATVGLGIFLVRSQWAAPQPVPTPTPAASVPARALGQQRSVEEVFALLDADRNGRLTRDEVPPDMWPRMARADADGDGSVTARELAAARARGQGRDSY
jgi:hypothetical protein